MTAILLLAFIGIPVIEIIAFIEIGGWIGLWPTIAIVVATAVAGTTLLRMQGMAVLQRFQQSVAKGQLPVAEVFDGLCLLVAGALLLTPGFFTDALGFLLFVPPVRLLVGQLLWTWISARKNMTASASVFPGQAGRTAPSQPQEGMIIDGDYDEVRTPSDQDQRPDKDGNRDD